MDFEKKWLEQLRGEINYIKIMRKTIKEGYAGPELNEKYNQCEIHLCNIIDTFFGLPFDLGKDYDLDIMDEGFPIIYSLEKINEALSVLWDTNHYLSTQAQMYENPINRIGIFLQGILKSKCDILALELTCDFGQDAIDRYIKGEISQEESAWLISESSMSTAFDNYTPLLDYARENGIKVAAVDIPKSEYENQFELPPVKTLFRKAGKIRNDKDMHESLRLSEYKRLSNIVYDTLNKYRDSFIKSKLDILTKEGRTLLIIGSGHRLNLLNILNRKDHVQVLLDSF